MMKTTLRIAALAVALSAATGAAYAKDPMVGGAPMYASKNIIENAVNSKDHTTLAPAVKAAGLVETLEGKGPFTVFAPTNEAFAKLPAGTVETLLKPENKDKLVKILTYHVVSGDNDAKAVMGMTSAKSVEGDTINISTKDGKVMLGNDKAMATVIKPDIKCTNGTIHWIDTVLMPTN